MATRKPRKKKAPREVIHKTGRVLVGSCLERLRELDDASVSSIVTDPPYELAFMGKAWDASGIAYNVDVWRECLRVLKPGGYLLAFGGTRTYHRMVVAIEDAGFEIRDSVHWIYGSGFPKSLDVSKAIDKAAGAEDAAKQWAGWGTALKPAHEPIVVARKPLDGTVANNVTTHGTGALNIDACRINRTEGDVSIGGYGNGGIGIGTVGEDSGEGKGAEWVTSTNGRWPANVILDEAAGEELDAQSGVSKSQGGRIGKKAQGTIAIGGAGTYKAGDPGYGDIGGASRFFYCPKPSRTERNAGLGGLPDRARPVHIQQLEAKREAEGKERVSDQTTKNFHPTVKPVALIGYLVRLVTPPGGVVLDPFLGSGTTAVAAIDEGFSWIGCELTLDYLPIISGRVRHAEKKRRVP